MSISFHASQPEDEGRLPKLPRVDLPVLELSDIPEHRPLAREALLVDALTHASLGNLHLLGESTRAALLGLGLIGEAGKPPALQVVRAGEKIVFVAHQIPADVRTLPLRVIALAVGRWGEKASCAFAQHLYDLVEVCGGGRGPKGEEFALQVRKLVLALHEDENLAVGGFGERLELALQQRLSHITLARNLQWYLTAEDYYVQREAISYLYEVGRHNSPPFLVGRRFAREQEEVRRRAEGIVTRSYKYTHSFDRFQRESRRVAQEAPSLLARFGEQCFDEAWKLKALDYNRPPGPGFLFSNVRMESLFFQGRHADNWYREAYRPYGRALEQLPKASYLLSRFCHGIFIDAPEYYLPVGEASGGRRELYGLLLANNHFTGSLDLAGLFPTRILRRKLLAACQDVRSERDDPGCDDITAPGFNLESLARECESLGLPALRLANISVAFGGAVAAYPRGSAPFYEWEAASPREHSIWQDRMGRTHHAWRALHFDDLGLEAAQLVRKRIEVLKPLQEGCRVVADAAEGLLNVLDLIHFRYDSWKCGLTPKQPDDALMLSEALEEHRVLREAEAGSHEFSVLCRVKRYDWSAAPEPLLDTHSLMLTIPNRPVRQLSLGRDSRERAAAIWRAEVMPLVARHSMWGERVESEHTLAFLPRSHVPKV